MTDTDRADLPPRLSEQQLFLLAYILYSERQSLDFRREFEHIVPISVETRLTLRWVDAESLSRELALEFDENGDRISAPPDPLEERIKRALDERS